MKKLWVKREDQKPPFDLSRPLSDADKSSLRGLSDYPIFFQKLLLARGIQDPLQIKNILYPEVSGLKDPMTILGMDLAVERIVKAFKNDELICIYTDFDLDGTSGLALLKFGLEGLGFKKITWMQPRRLAEGYGFHASLVDELHTQNVRLIVTVDVGISSHLAADRAKELGIDVIITDHHLPSETLPQALTIVNPNQPGDTSNLGYLCGAGVAFYLLRALKRRFFDDKDLPKNNFDLRQVLDFFAIATLTDMVPLIEDNRVLVKQGLVQLQNTQRPALRALMNELELSGRELTSQDVAMKLAPKINALSRMENEILPRDIYLIEDVKKAQETIHHVLQNNSDRVQHQAKAEELAQKYISEDLKQNEVVFVYSEEFHRGIVGLVATKLSQTYNKPAFVGSLSLEEGTMVGSARLPNQASGCLVESLAAASQYLIRSGGHSAAAGFELHRNNVEPVRSILNAYFKEARLLDKPQVLNFDAVVELEEIDLQMIRWLDFLGPYGAHFQIPLFRTNHVFVSSIKELRGGHLKIEVKNNKGFVFKDVMCFSPTPDLKDLILQARYEKIDFLFEVQKNIFNGNQKVQLILKEAMASADEEQTLSPDQEVGLT